MGEYRNGKWYEDASQKASGDYHWEADRGVDWRCRYEDAQQRIDELELVISNLETTKNITYGQAKAIIDGLNHCHIPQSKYDFLRIWMRDWMTQKLKSAKEQE